MTHDVAVSSWNVKGLPHVRVYIGRYRQFVESDR